MNVKSERPPNYDEIAKTFDIEGKPVVFTYGDMLYNPGRGNIPGHLMKHEETHAAQQTDPVAWWRQYLKDPQFRTQQELEAYQVQYKYFCKKEKNPHLRLRFLEHIARDLASEVYGKCISYQDALTQIEHGTA